MGDVGPAQFDDYRKIKELMPKVMLWGGEGLRNLVQVRPWMQEGIYDAMQNDCHRLGVTECWQVARVSSGHMCEFFMYPSAFRYDLLKQPYRPQNGHIELSDQAGFGMDLVDNFAEKFTYIPGPHTLANPRFPHAWERARAREKMVSGKYSA